MKTISSIRIKNFRSIVDQKFSPEDLTVIVGHNDVGKSNVLRALNLFFNGETDVGRPFDFASDYAKFAKSGKGKAKEVNIQLKLLPPFGKSNEVVWTKKWRQDRPQAESTRKNADGTDLAGLSKIGNWLDKIKFKYVPAIKGDEYFRSLMRDLHDTLAETIDENFRAASGGFIGQIREATKSISKILDESVGIDSAIQIPRDLRSLFEVLDFETTSRDQKVSFRQRGDGIKVRHIPAILKFLAEQEKKQSGSGKPRISTIWGYEEPENNLELTKGFQLAKQFAEYSRDVQILLTTHSPAFYSLASGTSNKGKCLVRATCPKPGETELREGEHSDQQLDEQMGLLPLVSPYIAEKEREFRDIEKQLQSVQDGLKPVVFLGGETDVKYVKAACRALGQEALLSQVDIRCVGINTPGGSVSSGDAPLKQLLSLIRMHPIVAKRALVVFDSDVKGQTTKVSGDVRVLHLERNEGNSRVTKGIENLLPEHLFSDEFYITNNGKRADGGEYRNSELNKKKLCAYICDRLPSAEQVKAFANFECLVQSIVGLRAP